MSSDDQSQVRRQKLQSLRDQKRAYPHNIQVTHTATQVLSAYQDIQDADTLKKAGPFVVAGRVALLRSFGKAGFVKIRDRSGLLQAYVAKDHLPPEQFEDFKNLDLGDIVHMEGALMRTKTGELSLLPHSFRIVVKCLHTPPEKFHGLSDIEERYRKRYLDLLSNDEARLTFLKKTQIMQGIRSFFLKRDFLEVETPMMHPLVSGATARPFTTHHNALDMKLFLRIAPELHLKRLVVGGFERVFEMNRNFRNEGISTRHNPEFTMLEFYMAYATYQELMDLTEELISELAEKICGSTQITYQERDISLARPWKRLTMEEAVRAHSEYTGSFTDDAAMRAYLNGKKVHMTGREQSGGLLTLIFEEDVEKKLIAPTFVTQYPVEVSPLARRSESLSPSGIEVTDRFELIINGGEIANGFNELNDPDDQRSRFEAQTKEKDAGNAEATDYDADYIQALEYGLPPTAGEGIGIDRLTMLLTDSPSIRDVILFPLLRHEA